MCADVVVVGGGPVGCWTAIQIKARNPEAEVQVYERHQEYKRDHMMSIRRSSLTRYAKGGVDADALYKKISEAHNTSKDKKTSRKLRRVTYIRTLDFERILKEECQRLGIKFEYKEIKTPQEVMALHPECQMFVGADGAHSAMRNALLGGEENSVTRKEMLPSVDVKYQVRGQAEYMRDPTFDKVDQIVIESISKVKRPEISEDDKAKLAQAEIDRRMEAYYEVMLDRGDIHSAEKARLIIEYKASLAAMPADELIAEQVKSSGSSEVALRFLVDKGTYDKLPNATFKNPANIATFRGFEEQIMEFQQLRADKTGERKINGTEKITKITLSQYASKKFAVRTGDNDNQRKAGWFFVGDAAMGMPFYRSINAGLLLGSQLGSILGGKMSVDNKARLYNAIRPLKIAREFGAVAAKLSGIRAYKGLVRPALRGLTATAGIGALIVLSPLIAVVAVYALLNPKARLM